MIPDKLKPGDEVRVVAPARSASDIDERVLDRAKAALESLGLKVTFSKNAFSRNQRGCPTDDEKVEDLHEAFERHVQALMQQPFFRQVKAILVGRFQDESRATDDMISDIILSKNIDSKIPVLVNLDFGHTDPKFTYPVGGKCEVVAGSNIKITSQ